MGLDGREKRREAGGTVSRELAIRPHGRLLGQTRGVEYHRTGGIWYRKAEIHDVQVKFAAGTATLYSRIHLNSVVGGNAVRFPFIVTEVYVMENGRWQLSTLAFTRTLGE